MICFKWNIQVMICFKWNIQCFCASSCVFLRPVSVPSPPFSAALCVCSSSPAQPRRVVMITCFLVWACGNNMLFLVSTLKSHDSTPKISEKRWKSRSAVVSTEEFICQEKFVFYKAVFNYSETAQVSRLSSLLQHPPARIPLPHHRHSCSGQTPAADWSRAWVMLPLCPALGAHPFSPVLASTARSLAYNSDHYYIHVRTYKFK